MSIGKLGGPLSTLHSIGSRFTSRTPWQGDVDLSKNISTEGILNEEGYVNVADELGLSGQRDYSSYHQYWVRRTLGDEY